MKKAYIVANKKQELDVLKKFEQEGLVWVDEEKPTEWLPSEKAFGLYTSDFPYVLSFIDNGSIIWFLIEELEDETVVYDGRKEEKMSKNYLVTQEFMNELIKWRYDYVLDATLGAPFEFVDGNNINDFPDVVKNWWGDPDNPIERNERLIAIIQWLNGEDVFEVEEPHKFVVRSDKNDSVGDYTYVSAEDDVTITFYTFNLATQFNTREEAQEWANSHQVVVEIDEEGNEVE